MVEAGDIEFLVNLYSTHPTIFNNDISSGLYKISVNAKGHITSVSSVSGNDLPNHSHNISDINNVNISGKSEPLPLVSYNNGIHVATNIDSGLIINNKSLPNIGFSTPASVSSIFDKIDITLANKISEEELVDMTVTYTDDTTETFQIIAKKTE